MRRNFPRARSGWFSRCATRHAVTLGGHSGWQDQKLSGGGAEYLECGPRDANGVIGPYESSLLDNPVVDPERPLEVLRTVHSFDPCIACAIHMVDTEQREIVQVKVL